MSVYEGPKSDTKPDSAVVVGRVGRWTKIRKWFTPLKMIIILLVILIAVVGIGLLVMRLHTSDSGGDAAVLGKGIPGVSYEEQQKNDLKSAQDRVARDEANPSVTKTQKSEDYRLLGIAYDDNDQPAEAIKAYQQALVVLPSNKQKVLSGLMYAYGENGQFPEAIAAGEELITILQSQKSSVGQQADISSITNSVNMLKSGKVL